ncbi:DNA translocase FtsK [Candidatus Solincola tengchongensis]|uniref:FtsK/SpoIIIE family DNA translocase n=1 Tax=Candidatus Solincola tengchongensis TaxID=2900693 RepID=UPI00257E0247|nr:DNA translocase FtsK [Candidatus Solincola tengchongensis]
MPRNLREIYGVSLLLAGVMLLLAFLSALGPVGRGLEWFFSYLLGYLRFPLPFLVAGVGLALLLGRLGDIGKAGEGRWRVTWVELAGVSVLLMGACALFHLRAGGPEEMFLLDNLFHGGGLVGAALSWPLVKLLGRTGAYVLVVGMLLVGFLLLTGLTLSQYLQERVEKRLKARRARRAALQGKRREPREAREPLPAEERAPAPPPVSTAEETAAGEVNPPRPRTERVSHPPLVIEEGGQVALEVRESGKPYRLPPLELLVRSERSSISHKSVNESIAVLERTLRDFGVDAAVTRVTRGPTVTRFEVELGSGVKVNRVLNLSDDIAYAMASPDIRIITPIPGKSAIGIEIPNRERDLVTLGDILSAPRARKPDSPLRVGLGMDVSGHPVLIDLRDMPHLLMAGATGTGKSCCINAIIASVLMTASPDEVRMLLVDPKYVELSHFNGIPHLLAPVITDPKKASSALAWVVREMEYRYQVLSRAGVKNIVAYLGALKEGLSEERDENGEPLFPPMPYILVVIDELADLMMVAPAEVEDSIARIAQMARAVGIHLVVATQRPSVDVVTGLIKANMPSRIAFTVASQADSRVILDVGGAEKLVGHGDMLFLPAGTSKPVRVQGAYVSEREIAAITGYIKRQKRADYREDILEEAGGERREKDHEDELLDEAIEIVVRSGVASASLLQRKLRVGYARAARLVDIMEDMGIVGGFEGSKPRAVLMTEEELEEMRRRRDRSRQEGGESGTAGGVG